MKKSELTSLLNAITEDREIMVRNEEDMHRLIEVEEIPVTMGDKEITKVIMLSFGPSLLEELNNAKK